MAGGWWVTKGEDRTMPELSTSHDDDDEPVDLDGRFNGITACDDDTSLDTNDGPFFPVFSGETSLAEDSEPVRKKTHTLQ